MKDFLVTVIIILLGFVFPAYLTFGLTLVYVVIGRAPSALLLVVGVFLDAHYGFSYQVIGRTIPLYSSLGLLLTATLPLITRRLIH